MKKFTSLASLIIVLSLPLLAQDTEVNESFRPIQFFVGIQPGVDMEPIDEFRYIVNVNLAPVQLEYAVNDKWSVRLSPKVFMQFRPEFPWALSRVGAGITVPYHFSKKNSEEGHRGFYAGPHAAYIMHRLDNYQSATLAGELGYYFLFNSVLSVNMGIQAGKTLRMDPNSSFIQIGNHTAAVLSFGLWF